MKLKVTKELMERLANNFNVETARF